MAEAPEKNLAMDIVRITEAAALASARWLGRGAKESGDGAAVEAMRNSFTTLHIDGVVVIGEGEKDKAPMLYTGENVGMGDGPSLDVAVDPVEGTNLLAYGRPNAISVMGVAPRGSMFSLDRSFYMQKLVVGSEAKDVVDLDAPVDVNLERVAKALGKKVSDLVVFVLDKPRRDVGAVGGVHRNIEPAMISHFTFVGVLENDLHRIDKLRSICVVKSGILADETDQFAIHIWIDKPPLVDRVPAISS